MVDAMMLLVFHQLGVDWAWLVMMAALVTAATWLEFRARAMEDG